MSGTAVIYASVGGAKLAVVDTIRQTVEMMTRIRGKMVREEVDVGSLVDLVDPNGTTWKRAGIGF